MELDKGRKAEVKQKLVVLWEIWLDKVSKFVDELRFLRLEMMKPSRLYKVLISRECYTISLSEQIEWADFYDATITSSWNVRYLVNLLPDVPT